MGESFETEIISLINNCIEGDYWDFKQVYYDPDKKGDMLHDIICMANLQGDHDGYIIFGVENNTGKVLGIENDPNRKRNEDFITFLREKHFSGGIRPSVLVKTIEYKGHEIDVLIIRNSRNIPFYLIEKFQDVRAFYIYTRVGDTNTPKDKSADINHVEYLWKKRFGMTTSPIFRFQQLLGEKNNWIRTDSDFDVKYYKYAPEFTIRLSKNDMYHGHYYFADYWTTHKPIIDNMSFYYFSTELETHPFVVVDDNRYAFPFPYASVISFSELNQPIRYFYYCKDTLRYAIFDYLEDDSYPYEAYKKPIKDMIPVFISDEERNAFEKILKTQSFDYYKEKMKNIADYYKESNGFYNSLQINEKEALDLNEEMKWNMLIVELLKRYRESIISQKNR